MARTRIVATIGPTSNNPTTITEMIAAGMNVARLNFAHGDHETHKNTVQMLRDVAASENAVLAILADLQGPKLRLGNIPSGGVQVDVDDEIVLTSHLDQPGTIHLPHPKLIQAAKPGTTLIIGDGEIELRVFEQDVDTLHCFVSVPGLIEARKGVHAPGTASSLVSITKKDKRDLEFICSLDIDYVALSFVRSAEDIHELRSMMDGFGMGITPIIAKIETREAIDCLTDILDAADGIMVARGDLGLEMPPEEVPILQKRIIRSCNEAAKPVITATQMLQSMVDSPRPTRAEASDVANAILDGSDAIMLSQETASGKYPVDAVNMMRQIAEWTEKEFPYDIWRSRRQQRVEETGAVTAAISTASCSVAEQVGARLILTTTMSGTTALKIAGHRPVTPILAVTPDLYTQRRLAIVWGVDSLVVDKVFTSTDDMLDRATLALEGLDLQKGDLIVITAGIPFGGAGYSNLIKVHEIS
jgi:pyruvate kinase